ncbi:MAG: 50S ribosomal protein L29 [Candidatus Omnitrophica bacterium 4484_70.2]|nr:MAG: 50S ribosomal protein L29 [Candidatus Omnitrophica bacterium 4484_70.2]
MKAHQLRMLSKEELRNRLRELKKEIMELNFQKKTAKVEKPHLFKEKRREVARILTILKEKENEKD